MSTQYEVTLECLEDMHIGSGLDLSGTAQAQHVRGADGAPMVPRESLRQMIKESARRLVAMDANAHPEAAFVALFGDGAGGHLRASDFRLARPANFAFHGQTALEFGARTASDKTLRTMECVSRGTTFSGRIEVTSADAAALRLVEDAMRGLRHLGGRRRRGLGLIRTRFEELATPTASPVRESPPVLNSQRVAVRLWVRSIDPVCIGVGDQATYLLRTHDHIPGSSLLGAFRRRWKGETAERRVDLGKLLENAGPASFGDLLPYSSDGGPVPLGLPLSGLPLPAPSSCRKPKRAVSADRGEATTFGWANVSPATSSVASVLNALGPGSDELDGKPKRLGRDQFLIRTADENTLSIYRAQKEIRPRNHIGAERQRVLKEDGFFAVEYLSPGQVFVGEIVIDGPHAGEQGALLRDWLVEYEQGSPLRLGHGLGAVEIAEVELLDADSVEAISRSKRNDFDVVLTFTSPLLCDTRFGTADDGIEAYLERALGGSVRVVRVQANGFIESGGFHFSGLPRFSHAGLGRGSCVTFAVDADDFATTSRELALQGRKGIGRGTIHGHGRFIVGHPIMTRRIWGRTERARAVARPSLSGLALVEEVLHENLWQTIKAPSQWGRFVAIVEGLRAAELPSSAIIGEISKRLGKPAESEPWESVLKGLGERIHPGLDGADPRAAWDFLSWVGRLNRTRAQAERRKGL